jgi:hypothetical protein
MNKDLSVMGVASCRSTFLCLVLCVRLVPSRFSVRDWGRVVRLGLGCAYRGFQSAKWPGPTQPSPARPGPARPWRPHPPMRPLLLSLSHLDLPRNNLPLPLPPLSPLGPAAAPAPAPSPAAAPAPAPAWSACPCPRSGRPPARPLPPARSSLRAASAPYAWHPNSRRDSRGLVYPLTHSRVRKPTRAVIISGL